MRKVLDRIAGTVSSALLGLMVLIAMYQVLTRYVLNSPSVTSEEMLRYGLIWLTLIGGAYVYGKNQHLAIIFFGNKLPQKFQPAIAIFVEIIVIIFSIVLLIYGGMNTTVNAVGQVSAALQMPMQYYYLCLPIGGVLFLIYAVLNLANLINKKQTAQEKD